MFSISKLSARVQIFWACFLEVDKKSGAFYPLGECNGCGGVHLLASLRSANNYLRRSVTIQILVKVNTVGRLMSNSLIDKNFGSFLH